MELSELREISVKLAEQSRPSSSEQNVRYSQVPKTLGTFDLCPTARITVIPPTLQTARPFESTATTSSRSAIVPLVLSPFDSPKHPIGGSSFGFHLTPCFPQIRLGLYRSIPGKVGSAGWPLASRWMPCALTTNSVAKKTGRLRARMTPPDFFSSFLPQFNHTSLLEEFLGLLARVTDSSVAAKASAIWGTPTVMAASWARKHLTHIGPDGSLML